MTVLLTLSAALFFYGLLQLFGLSLRELVSEVASQILAKRNKSLVLRKRIEKTTKIRRRSAIERMIRETTEVLRITGKMKQWNLTVTVSIVLGILGLLISVMLGNALLFFVLPLGLSMLPLLFVQISARQYLAEVTAELETALSLITTSYLRTDTTILRAIEENVPILTEPVKSMFEHFLGKTRLVHADTSRALSELKDSFDDEVFHEWVDMLIQCQRDRTLKEELPLITGKLADMRMVAKDMEILLLPPLREYLSMLLLVLLLPALLFFMNRDWLSVLTETTFGHSLIAMMLAVIFFTSYRVAQQLRPVRYRR